MAGCGGNCACSNAMTSSSHPMKENTFPKAVNVINVEVIEDDDLRKLVSDYFINDTKETLEKQQRDIFHAYKSVYLKNTLIHIVETLSFALTDVNVEKRAKGTGLLAECILQCLPGSLDELEVDTLMRFFCDRLKDHHSIQPTVIYAFLGLLSYQNVRNELIISMVLAIFSEVHIQSLQHADRRNVFNIFSNLLKTKKDVLKSFESEFLLGFIQAMDSERDPRNLLICFENSLLVIRHLDIKLFAEDLFEILSCYFPVEFREPKEDHFRIKKDTLVTSLRKCLSATKLFGPYAIPLYLEKLSSDLVESKLDTLITFTECLEVYNPEDIALHIDEIWLGIRRDYLLSDFAELAKPYLDFIYKLMRCLSDLENADPVMKIVDFLIKDCTQTLKDPEITIAIPCGNVILQASNASGTVYNEILNKLTLPLQSTLDKYSSVLQRTGIMEIVTKIFCVEHPNKIDNVLLNQFVDYLLPLLYNMCANCEDTKLQVLCVRCLGQILAKSSWFEHCDFDILVYHCLSPLMERMVAPDLIEEYKLCIEILSQQSPTIFKHRYLEFLENNLVDKVEKGVVSQCLDLLPFISFENKELVNNVYEYFNNFINLITDTNIEQYGYVLECYAKILRKSTGSIDKKFFFLPLVNMVMSGVLPDNLFWKICYALSESFRHLSIQQYKEAILFVTALLTDEECPGDSLFPCTTTFLNPENNLLNLSMLLRGVLTQIKPCDLPEIGVDNLCKGLLQVIERTSDPTILTHICVVFGSIINKLPTESSLATTYIDIIRNLISGGMPCNYAVTMLNWLTKGLVLNWQSSTTIAIDTMLICLKKEELADTCVEGFDIIVKNFEYVFTKESNALIKPIFKQRYSEYVLPLLIQQYHNGEKSVKSFHMSAISSTLQIIPKQMLAKHMKSMIPLLMHSLTTCDTPQITESTLSTISLVLGQNKDIIIDYIPSLLSRLLNLVTHGTMNIRILCLNSLAILSTYTSHVVQPMQQEVIRKVRLVLDDQKRLVRKEAIRCSNAWHLMASSEE